MVNAQTLEAEKEKIQELLASAKFAEALDLLQEFLPKESAKQATLIILENNHNQLNLQIIEGTATQEEIQADRNKLLKSFLTFLNSISLEDFQEKPEEAEAAGDESTQGHLLHKIPRTMKMNEECNCIVRLAYTKAAIVKNIDLSEEVELQSVEIAKVMQVELLDGNKEKTFEIRTLNSAIQPLADKDSGNYTEWIFKVMPLKEGTFPITIKAAVVEIIDGEKYFREIVLEETVDIVTTQPASDPPADFQPGQSFGLSQPQAVAPPITMEAESQSVVSPPPVQTKKKGGARKKLSIAAMALAALMVANVGVYAAVPAQFEWGVTRYILDSEESYDRYIKRWEEKKGKDLKYVEEAYFRKSQIAKEQEDKIKFHEDYLAKYPEGQHTEQLQYDVAPLKNRVRDYLDYLEKFPEGEHAEDASFNVVKTVDKLTGYDRFLEDYPNGKYVGEVKNILKTGEDTYYDRVKDGTNLPELNAFMKLFPDSQYKNDLEDILAGLGGDNEEAGDDNSIAEEEAETNTPSGEEQKTSLDDLISEEEETAIVDKIKSTKDKITSKVDETGDPVEKVKEKGEEVIATKTDEAKDKVENKTGEVKDEVVNKTDETIDKVEEKTEELGEKITDKLPISGIMVKGPTKNDVQKYRSRKINGATWLTENLSVGIKESVCAGSSRADCRNNGRLYTFEQAKEACKQLGAGWQLPSQADWGKLFSAYGDINSISPENKKKVYDAFIPGGASGFYAGFAGFIDDSGQAKEYGVKGYYWTSSTQGGASSVFYFIKETNNQPGRVYTEALSKNAKSSCRCIKK